MLAPTGRLRNLGRRRSEQGQLQRLPRCVCLQSQLPLPMPAFADFPGICAAPIWQLAPTTPTGPCCCLQVPASPLFY